MQINSLPKSNITEQVGAAGVATAPPPVKATPTPKAPTPPAPADKAPAAPATTPAKTPEAVKDAAKSTEGTKTELTDVKATGTENSDGDPIFTLKINGKEVKATQAEIVQLAQKAAGAEAAMKRAAEVEKLAANFLNQFDANAMQLLIQRHGKDKAKEIIIGMTRSLIAEEELTPEQRENQELRKFKEEKEAESAAAKKAEEDAKRGEARQQLYKKLLTEIDTELNETHLPKDKLTLTRVLNYIAAGKKSNGEKWTVRDAVKAVEMEDMSHVTHYAKRYTAGLLPSEQFRQIFGEETFKKLNKEQIEALKGADKIVKKSEPAETSEEKPAPQRSPRSLSRNRGNEGMSEREYRRKHGSIGGI